ncbi:unnamed protein product, partial [Natator depressus]
MHEGVTLKLTALSKQEVGVPKASGDVRGLTHANTPPNTGFSLTKDNCEWGAVEGERTGVLKGHLFVGLSHCKGSEVTLQLLFLDRRRPSGSGVRGIPCTGLSMAKAQHQPGTSQLQAMRSVSTGWACCSPTPGSRRTSSGSLPMGLSKWTTSPSFAKECQCCTSSPPPSRGSGTRWRTRSRTCTPRLWRTSARSWLPSWRSTCGC